MSALEPVLVDDGDLPEQIDSEPWDGPGEADAPDEIFDETLQDEDED